MEFRSSEPESHRQGASARRRRALGWSPLVPERLERRWLLDAIPLGPSTVVNEYTTGRQGTAEIAVDPSGNFVVVWDGVDATDGLSRVQARLFDSTGAPRGAAFRVSDQPMTFSQHAPDVAIDDAGNFAVVWNHPTSATDPDSSIWLRRFDAQGNPLGDAALVSAQPDFDEFRPAIAMTGAGDLVITWQKQYPPSRYEDVFARRYINGAPAGWEFRVNTHTISPQHEADVAIADSGDFVVVWTSDSQDGDASGIFGQRYNELGVPQGAEFRVNTHTTDYQSHPAVATDAAGNFLVTWHGRAGIALEEVYARRFDAAGIAAQDDFIVNTVTTQDQRIPSVAATSDGGYVIAWMNWLPAEGVYARLIDAGGVPRGSAFRVNEPQPQGGEIPDVAADSSGRFVVSWSLRSGDYDVYVRRFALSDTRPPAVDEFRFRFETRPHRFAVRFSEDVSSSLSGDEVLVERIPAGGPPQVITNLAYSGFDPLTRTATYTYQGGTGVLPDGRYRLTILASRVSDAAGNPLDGNGDGTGGDDFVAGFVFFTGDADNDGIVNLRDFNILAANFGQSPRDFAQGDFNYDGVVNLRDFNLLAGHFGSSLARAEWSVDSPRPAGRVIDLLTDADH